MTLPLTGVHVLDMADEPLVMAPRLLADLGADVTRVESIAGDRLRRRSPFVDNVEGIERGLAHLLYNAGKRSLALDLDRPESWRLLERLVPQVDLIVAPLGRDPLASEFFQEGRLESLATGLGIVEAVFRRGSPESEVTDLIGTAAGGLLVLNGFRDEPPNHPAGNLAYKQTSLAAALAAVSLVLERARSGAGGRITVSMQEAVMGTTIQSANENYWYWHEARPSRTGLQGLGGQTIFETRDGQWVSFYQHPPAWARFAEWVAEALGESRFLDPEWDDGLYRYHNHGQIARVTATLCLKMSREEVVDEGQRRSILVVPVQGVADIARDPHLRERGFFQQVRYEHLERTVEVPRPPFTGSAYEMEVRRAPALGEHSRDILSTFGLSADEIDSLIGEGIVGTRLAEVHQ